MVLKSLQAARGAAALAVAAFHLSINMGAERYGGYAALREFTRHGDRGVDFFFVLSGFIILLAHHRDIGKPVALRGYLMKRFVRIYPIYLVYTGAFVLAFLAFGGVDARIPTSTVDWLTSLSLIRFSDGTPPLQVAWTLFHEVAFYLVFGAMVIGWLAGAVAMLAFTVPALILLNFPGEADRDALAVYTAGYNLLFIFGMASWFLYRRPGNGVPELGVGVAVSIAALAGGVHSPAAIGLVLGGGLALVVAGITKAERAGLLRVPSAASFVGDASYSIYLTHVSVEGVLLKIALKVGLWSVLSPEAIFGVVLVGTICIGCIAYVVAERPLLEFARRRLVDPRRPARPGSAGSA